MTGRGFAGSENRPEGAVIALNLLGSTEALLHFRVRIDALIVRYAVTSFDREVLEYLLKQFLGSLNAAESGYQLEGAFNLPKNIPTTTK